MGPLKLGFWASSDDLAVGRLVSACLFIVVSSWSVSEETRSEQEETADICHCDPGRLSPIDTYVACRV